MMIAGLAKVLHQNGRGVLDCYPALACVQKAADQAERLQANCVKIADVCQIDDDIISTGAR